MSVISDWEHKHEVHPISELRVPGDKVYWQNFHRTETYEGVVVRWKNVIMEVEVDDVTAFRLGLKDTNIIKFEF